MMKRAQRCFFVLAVTAAVVAFCIPQSAKAGFAQNDPVNSVDPLGLMDASWQYSLTRNKGKYLGVTDPYSSKLTCNCNTNCEANCKLNAVIKVNVEPGLEDVPKPLDFATTFFHEVKHVKAFVWLFQSFATIVTPYEKKYATVEECKTEVAKVISKFDQDLQNLGKEQSKVGLFDGHPKGWDQYSPENKELTDFINKYGPKAGEKEK